MNRRNTQPRFIASLSCLLFTVAGCNGCDSSRTAIAAPSSCTAKVYHLGTGKPDSFVGWSLSNMSDSVDGKWLDSLPGIVGGVAQINIPIGFGNGGSRTVHVSVTSGAVEMTEPQNNVCPRGSDATGVVFRPCIRRGLGFSVQTPQWTAAPLDFYQTVDRIVLDIGDEPLDANTDTLTAIWQASGVVRLSTSFAAEITVSECK